MLDLQPLVFDNSQSGQKPQRRYGENYMQRYTALLLLRILVTLRLGGNVELIMSGESSQDMMKATRLGKEIGLLEYSEATVRCGATTSGQLLCRWLQNYEALTTYFTC